MPMMLKNNIAFLVAALLVNGCQIELDPQLENRNYLSTVSPSRANMDDPLVYKGPYRHLVYFATEDSKLRKQLETLTQYSGSMVVATDDSKYNHLRMVVAPEEKIVATTSHPYIFGVLKPTTYPSSIAVKYLLSNSAGTVLAKGDILGVGPERVVINPGQAASLKHDPAAMAEVTAQLMKILLKHNHAEPWQANVVERSLDGIHLTINMGKEVGIRNGHRFVTTEKPKAELEVITFETTETGGTGRAILKLVSGVLPQIGTPLVPAK